MTEVSYPIGNRDEIRYITEVRGGWDNWSPMYRAVLGIVLPDGTEYMQHKIEDVFIYEPATYPRDFGPPATPDNEPIPIVVELPFRTGDDITIEWYQPSYNFENVGLNVFQKRFKNDMIKVKDD